MKIRIRGNSLRLRLTQTEVQQFEKQGYIGETIRFGINPKNQLSYILKKCDRATINAEFTDNEITVFIPTIMGNSWAGTDLVGLSQKVSISENLDLDILIEKDFKCLTKRIGEDETDNYPNPLQKHPSC